MRFDDLVRTEKYFTATLLPFVLMHERFRGLDAFAQLVESRSKTERTASGEARAKEATNYSFDDPEVITEFHIARDLGAGGIALLEDDDEDSPESHRDAPDLVVVAGVEMLVCEGKFFERRRSVEKLNRQLRSQRRQVAHLMECRRELRAYRHVAIVPSDPTSPIDCDAVLGWNDIADLASSILGDGHYVTIRLQNAVARYAKASRRRGAGSRPLQTIIDLREATFVQARASFLEPVHVDYVPAGETRKGIKVTLQAGRVYVTMHDVDTGAHQTCGIGELLKYATAHEPGAYADRIRAVAQLGAKSPVKAKHYSAERMVKWRMDADGRCAICGGQCRSAPSGG